MQSLAFCRPFNYERSLREILVSAVCDGDLVNLVSACHGGGRLQKQRKYRNESFGDQLLDLCSSSLELRSQYYPLLCDSCYLRTLRIW